MNGTANIVKRRGWCPGVRRPMETGDGLLVRIHPAGGRVIAEVARLIAQASDAHGNGLLDITARGNLQIRGVREDSYPALLQLLEQHALAEPEGEGPNRLTLVSPLAGLDPHEHCDAFALAQTIENGANALANLPAKFFIAVDDGGLMPMNDVGADLHLLALDSQTIAFGFASAEAPFWIGTTPLTRAPDTAYAVLSGFAEMRRSGRTEARRLRDLPPNLKQELAGLAQLGPPALPGKRAEALRAGAIALGSAQAALLALPFGRCSSKQLVQAAEWSERLGSGEVRLSFTRGLLLPGIAPTDMKALLEQAGRAGFIISADDPRLSVFACPGRPACASAGTAAPEQALQIAEAAKDLLAGGATLHVSGCAKGCAHPGKADLTLVGRDDGSYGVVLDGTTRDPHSIHLSLEDIMNRLSALETPNDLRSAFPESAR